MNLIKKLHPWITTYSALLKNCHHGQEVTVGGKIIDKTVVNVDDKTMNCFLDIDDGTDEFTAMLPDGVYQAFKDETNMGSLVKIEGKVFILKIPDKRKQETKVIAYDIANIKTTKT